MYVCQSVPGDGDTAVYRRIQAKIVVPGAPRDDRAHPVKIDNVFPVAAHKSRCWEFFSKLAQPLYGFIRFFPLRSNQRILALGFEIKNSLNFDQINRSGSLRMIPSVVLMVAQYVQFS